MRRILIPTMVILMSTSCVSIHEGVQVERPGEMDTRQNITDKCPNRPYPHRMLRMHAGGSSRIVTEGGRTVSNQADFDQYWPDLTLDPGQTLVSTVEGTNKPLIDWNTQWAAFYSFRSDSTCQILTPAVTPMETDCLRVTLYFSHYWLKKECQDRTEYPVYVFIFPRTELPMEIKWTDDPDKDGISNDSEITVGTDPMDAKSKP